MFGLTQSVSFLASHHFLTPIQESRKSNHCHTSENRARKSFACHTSKKRVCKSFSCHTFSNFKFAVPLWNTGQLPFAITFYRNYLTPLESRLTKTSPLKSFKMNTYAKKGRGLPRADLRDCRTAHFRKIGRLTRTNPSRPLRFAALACKIRSGLGRVSGFVPTNPEFVTTETSSLPSVSNRLSGVLRRKRANVLVTDLWSLITSFRAGKAPRV